MTDADERTYEAGSRRAWLHMLQQCLIHLRGEQIENLDAAVLAKEIEEAKAQLRQLCEYHGDNDWPDNLHLADVIEKHLADHLENEPPTAVILQCGGRKVYSIVGGSISIEEEIARFGTKKVCLRFTTEA